MNKIKKLYNKFIEWYYRLDIAAVEQKIMHEDIDKAVYALEDFKKKVHPKTDIAIILTKQLDDRIKRGLDGR